MPQFNSQADADRWWGIGQSLGYTGKQDGSGGLGKWLDTTGQRQTAENLYNNNKTVAPTGVRPLAQVEPLSDWTKQGLTGLASGAPTTGDMQFARDSLKDAAGIAKGNVYKSNINPYLQAATQSFNPQTAAQAYMNPYQTQVMDAFNAEADRTRAKQQNDINATFARGAFGSARQGVREAEADRDINQLKLNNAANLMFQGYTNSLSNAMNQFNTEANRQLQTGQVGMQDAMNQYNTGNQTAQTLAALASPAVNLRNAFLDQWRQGQSDKLLAGDRVQAQNQAELDAYNAQRLGLAGWDRGSVDWLGNALGRFPSGQTQTPYQANSMQTLGGLGMLGAGFLQSGGFGNGMSGLPDYAYNIPGGIRIGGL